MRHPARCRSPARLLLSFAALLLVLAAPLARAAEADGGLIAEQARRLVERQAIAGGEIEVTVGEIDPRLALAPCDDIEPFVPRGARLWGRSSIGIRCLSGARWTVYVPVQVRVFAPVPVAARPLQRGHTLAEGDLRIDRVDLTLAGGALFTADDRLEGLVVSRAVAPGEPLRRDVAKPPAAVAAGDAVKIVIDGPGIVIATAGKALSAAALGESARVVTANGKVLTGVAHPGKVVAVR